MTVVDASVAAKWYLPEAGTPAALALLEGPTLLFAPALARLEVAAAVTRSARVGDSTPAEARKRYGDWLRHLDAGAVSLIPDEELLADAVGLALGLGHPLQDCLYLAASNRLGVPLVTADRVFRDRASGKHPGVYLLAGCEGN